MVVAASSAEMEFRAANHGICELIWLKKLLKDLKFPSSLPMKLQCDKKEAINIPNNPI